MPFQPAGLGLEIFGDRYARFAGETWEEACQRVASHVSKAETNGKVKVYEERFYDELVNNRFMPGGRIFYGSGRPKAQLLNCFVLPTADSREGWGKTLSDVIVVSGTGGGVGINCSPVRGRGSDILGTGGVATGAVSLMQMVDRVGDVLVSGGGRRLALMLCLNVDHPDIEEFLSVKLDLDQLTNANISVVIDIDPVEFQRLVREDGEIPLTFNKVATGKSIRARKLWEQIVENAWKSGEPGILNGYLANKQSNIFYHAPLISTNPCGEIWLEAYGSCCLGALVLPRFVQDGAFNWDEFDSSIRAGVRFLDDVLTVNQYPLPEIKDNSERVRRLGMGVMGLHSMLLELGFNYTSPEALAFVDKLFSTLKNTAYDASINLAIEKGPFPAYDPRLLESGFSKTLKRGIRNKIKEHGLRNCALLTIAPTGTTSMVAGVSSGIEPLFAPVYKRHFFKPTSDGLKVNAEEIVVTPEFQRFGLLAQGAYDVSPREHFEMQKTVQAHLDNACSKTVNLPKDFPVEELSDLWLEFLPYLKGTTFYREGSRGSEPLEYIPTDEWVAYQKEHESWETLMAPVFEYNPIDQATMDCVDGVCEIPPVVATV